MSLEHAILGFLNASPRSGYELKTRCFDVEAKAMWTADQAQIYRTLERLRTLRLVSVTRRRQTGKPDRKVYEITDAGLEEFARWETAAASLPPARDAFLLQVYFAGSCSDEALKTLLSDRRQMHQSRLDELRALAVELSQAPGSPRATALKQAAYDGAIAMELAAIDWIDDAVDAVERGLVPQPPASQESPGNPLFGWAQA